MSGASRESPVSLGLGAELSEAWRGAAAAGGDGGRVDEAEEGDGGA